MIGLTTIVVEFKRQPVDDWGKVFRDELRFSLSSGEGVTHIAVRDTRRDQATSVGNFIAAVASGGDAVLSLVDETLGEQCVELTLDGSELMLTKGPEWGTEYSCGLPREAAIGIIPGLQAWVAATDEQARSEAEALTPA